MVNTRTSNNTRPKKDGIFTQIARHITATIQKTSRDPKNAESTLRNLLATELQHFSTATICVPLKRLVHKGIGHSDFSKLPNKIQK